MALSGAVEFHQSALQAQQAAGPTLAYYGMVERRYANWMSERLGHAPSLDALNPTNVRAFARWLQVEAPCRRGRGYSVGLGPESVSQYVGILKIWSRFLANQEVLGADPLARVRLPKVPRKVIAVLSRDDLARMRDLCATRRQRWRDTAMFCLLIETGMRVSELTGLLDADYQPWSQRRLGSVKVLGKGSRERVLYFGRECGLVVEKWRALERNDSSAHLFCDRDGLRLERGVVDELVHDLGGRAGVRGVRLSPHTLRHSWATIFAEDHPERVFQLQQLLGHSDLRQTQQYIRTARLNVEGGYASFLDGLREKRRAGR